MMELAAFALAFAGFSALMLAMERHHRDVFGGKPARWRRRVLKVAGFAGLTLSLAACLMAQGVIGLVEWVGVLAAGATLAVLGMTYRPKAVPVLGAVALLLSLAGPAALLTHAASPAHSVSR